MRLHIVNKSPEQNSALADCLAHCADTDSLLLIEDAVVAAVKGHPALQEYAGKIYALQEDVAARGIQALLSADVALVDYAGFVALCAEHRQNLSWF